MLAKLKYESRFDENLSKSVKFALAHLVEENVNCTAYQVLGLSSIKRVQLPHNRVIVLLYKAFRFFFFF